MAQRLHVVLEELTGGGGHAAPTEVLDVADALELAVEALQQHPSLGRTWLLLVALTASFPKAALVRAAHRRLAHGSKQDVSVWLLREAARDMTAADAVAEIVLEKHRPVVDVDFSASNELMTGIQRVVRNVVPRWSDREPIVLVKWHGSKMFGGLTDEELARVRALGRVGTGVSPTLRIVPWGVPVLLPEVPFPGHGDRLAALAKFSPSSVRAVGYDCIPVASAELVGEADRKKFSEYLEMIKFVDLVVGISESAAGEFRGFNAALGTQGVRGPEVAVCSLPTTTTTTTTTATTTPPQRAPSGIPDVITIGTWDKRKNQIVLVEAAEHLWREGLRFRLRFVGFPGNGSAPLMDLIEELQDVGRPIVLEGKLPDQDVAAIYASARLAALTSLHEGFGLPVVEALSHGVPVVTSDFGCLREVGEGQGALVVDPEDVMAVAEAMRAILLDDAVHGDLVARARGRAPRTWDHYAAELWEAMLS